MAYFVPYTYTKPTPRRDALIQRRHARMLMPKFKIPLSGIRANGTLGFLKREGTEKKR